MQQQSHFDIFVFVSLVLIIIGVGACSQASPPAVDESVGQTEVTPTLKASTPAVDEAVDRTEVIPVDPPTATPDIANLLREFSEYIPKYNENATPVLPPDYSVSGSIWSWSIGIPAKPVDTVPEFIDHPKFEEKPVDVSLFEEAKCGGTASDLFLDCTFTSPLVVFDCYAFANPFGTGSGLDPAYPIVAECLYEPDYEDEASDEYLYQSGCLFVDNTGYIFKIDDEYVLVKTAEKMQDLFAPIDGPEEALSYAVMLTGMQAMYDFWIEPEYTIYYLDVLEDTHVTTIDTGYTVHLYHQEVCGCDTYLTSQVDVIVNHDGTIEWGSVTPAYQQIYEGMCVD